MKDHPGSGGSVADRIEGAVVRHQIEHVAGIGVRDPTPRRDGDPQVAPIANTAGRGTVDQMRPSGGEQSAEADADRLPIADGEKVSTLHLAVDLQVIEDADYRVFAAGVLDVDENSASRRGR